jgi:hypothetical protein
MDTMAMQFEGFQSMVKTRLDKLSDLEAWPLVNGHLPGALLATYSNMEYIITSP